MTLNTNARVAGFTFWIYVAAGIASMRLVGNAPATGVLALVTSFCAVVLGVTLYAITREEDRDLDVTTRPHPCRRTGTRVRLCRALCHKCSAASLASPHLRQFE
jgi:hypothetical protein